MVKPTQVTNSIRALRFAHGEMTQADLAERIGVTRQTVIAIEQGKYSPSLEMAFQIARVFGVPLDDVFQYPDEGDNTVKAIVQDTYGSADVLELREIDRPEVGEHDVLFAVEAAGVDRSVWHTMTGRPTMARLFLGLRAPKVRVRGGEAAGTVVEVGSAVTRFAVGDAVFGTAPGTYAEFAVAAEDRLAHRPANVTAAQAASLPISGAAAWFAVEAVAHRARPPHPGARRLGRGRRVRRAAREGGRRARHRRRVDRQARLRPLARRRRGARLHGRRRPRGRRRRTTRSSTSAATARSASCAKALTRRGTLAIVGGEDGRGRVLGGFQRQMFSGVVSAFVPQRLAGVMSNEGAVPLEAVRAAAEAGVLVPSIEREFSLAEAPDAIRALEARSIRGKVVVRVAKKPARVG